MDKYNTFTVQKEKNCTAVNTDRNIKTRVVLETLKREPSSRELDQQQQHITTNKKPNVGLIVSF